MWDSIKFYIISINYNMIFMLKEIESESYGLDNTAPIGQSP